MISRFILVVLLLSACLPQAKPDKITPPKDFNAIKSAITNVLHQQAEDWNKGSIDDFMKGYWHSDSLQFIGMGGIKTGYDTVTARYKRHYDTKDKMGTLTFSDLVIEPLDSDTNLVHVTGKWHVQLKDTAQAGLFSLIWKQVGNDWRIMIDHTW